MKLFQKLLISTVATTFAVPVLAQDTLKITVTGTRSERAVEDIPASIKVIDLDDLRNQGNTDLKSITRYEPGISIFDPRDSGNYRGTTSTGNLNIRGMRNNRILGIQDGIRLPAGFYGVGYDYSNLNTVDYFTLKTIDILKGPASSLYGSDALGGVVSYNTLTADDLLEEGEKVKYEFPAKFNSSNSSLGGAVRVAYRDEESGLSFLTVLSKSERNELKPNGAKDEYINPAEISTDAALINVSKQIDPSNKIGFTIDTYYNDRDIARSSGNLSTGYFNYTKQESDVNQQKNRYIFSWEHDPIDKTNFIDNLKAKIYYQDYETRDNWNEFQAANFATSFQARDVYSRYKLIDDSYGLDLQLSSDINNHKLTYGVDYSLTANEYSQDKFTKSATTGAVSHTYFGTNYPIKRSPDTDTQRLGVYIQDEVAYGKTDFIYGLRVDNYQLNAYPDATYTDYCKKGSDPCPVGDLDATSFTPKIAATREISDALKVYGQYSRGFRAPSWWEMQASQTNLSASDPYQTQPNPDLKPETSDSFEIGLRGDYEKFNFGLTAFFNTYNDFIDTSVDQGTENIVDENGVTIADVDITMADNIEGAEIWGIEYKSEYKFTPETGGFSVITSAAYQKGTNKVNNDDLGNIDPFKFVSGLRFTNPDERFTGELIGTYVGKAVGNSYSGYDPAAYYTVDLLTKFKANDRLDFSVGINNLFNEKYYQYQNVSSSASGDKLEQYREAGTNVQAQFKLTF